MALSSQIKTYSKLFNEVSFPDKSWESISPEDAGFNNIWWNLNVAGQNFHGSTLLGERHGSEEWGIVLCKAGRILKTWGNPHYKFQSASCGKTLTRLCLQLAIDKGLILNADEVVSDYWSGEGEMTHSRKYLNRGFHQRLTFKHLAEHRGGFSVSNGYQYWQENKDPIMENYAQWEPGFKFHYSSGGYWRLSQALTAVWNQDLKSVLQSNIMEKIGIGPEDWDWYQGKSVFENKTFYPDNPGYGDFLDPPYSINNIPVYGGGGWMVMSPLNMARMGLLIATGGIWKNERILKNSFLIEGQDGGNGSSLLGIKYGHYSLGQLTAAGIPENFFNKIFNFK
jgi:CubicO group peptidase (beta-lactamase class C family)